MNRKEILLEIKPHPSDVFFPNQNKYIPRIYYTVLLFFSLIISYGLGIGTAKIIASQNTIYTSNTPPSFPTNIWWSHFVFLSIGITEFVVTFVCVAFFCYHIKACCHHYHYQKNENEIKI